ncbi:hypothetical protein O6H91_12G044900 [Diphasiastrum complanatum]|uniref:Uncharacterized protein n=2 Tax=Diphasiastrum complanatum TaxID=34168 RepID=A0ACC2C1P1_DIPCM|nr:hypothetical protein O6H91_12G044900 [Diphasiastrum complanatum]KAJ7535763.1 hypothetical protein O6H91_12G044900 [Diphasiastrum complanatum]
MLTRNRGNIRNFSNNTLKDSVKTISRHTSKCSESFPNSLHLRPVLPGEVAWTEVSPEEREGLIEKPSLDGRGYKRYRSSLFDRRTSSVQNETTGSIKQCLSVSRSTIEQSNGDSKQAEINIENLPFNGSRKRNGTEDPMDVYSGDARRSCWQVDETRRLKWRESNANEHELTVWVDRLRRRPQSHMSTKVKQRQVEIKMQDDASNAGCKVGEKRSLDRREGLEHKHCSIGEECGNDASPWGSWTRRVKRKSRSRARHSSAKVLGRASWVTSEPFSSDPLNNKIKSYHPYHHQWTESVATKTDSTSYNNHRTQKENANFGIHPHKEVDGDRRSPTKAEGRFPSPILKTNLGATISDCSEGHKTVFLNESGGQLSDSRCKDLLQLSKADEFCDIVLESVNHSSIEKDKDGFRCSSTLTGYGVSFQTSNSRKKVRRDASEGSDSHVPKQASLKLEECVRVEGPPTSGVFTNGQHTNSNFSSDKADEIGLSDIFTKPSLLAGRKCGLCGGGSNGELPKEMVLGLGSFDDIKERDNSAVGSHTVQNTAAMQKSGWLGKLLGPLSDHIGVAGVWVHQQCAIWSPEVYFLGVGRLKNVQAALRRGRHLKCSRCSQPGATIGCRVDRCSRTYHLPCARLEGCSFDHKKYLMACVDHLHLFRCRRNKDPRSGPHTSQGRHNYLKGESNSNRSWPNVISNASADFSFLVKDVKDEDKWLENAGEDEEFLKRERKRLQRDLARLAPIILGGSFESATNAEGWESVAGLQDVVECLKEMVILPLLYPGSFKSLGILPPRGVLLHGHPGTGKTHVVRALAGACARGKQKVAYFSRKGADCLGKYVGDSERQLRLLFQMAEQYQPSIIFFDEIDGLAPKRSQHQDQTHCSVVSTLLALMDGLKPRGSVVVIGATNRPDALDPALRRPGRFDREVYFPLPSIEDRAAILTLHTKKWANKPSHKVIWEVANLTSGFAGADLQALCTQAAMTALKRFCPLKELLDSVGKQTKICELQALPDVQVKAVDWAAALVKGSPPCSRRMANIAFSEVSVAPLPKHVVPVLLQPLVQILLCLDFDGRFLLPPVLTRTVCLAKVALRHASVKAVNSTDSSLLSHLNEYCSKMSVARGLEHALIQGGLIADVHKVLPTEECPLPTRNHPFGSCETTQKAAKSCELIDSVSGCAIDLAEGEQFEPGKQKWKASKFRVLITGGFGHGQNLLASCLLHGFEGAAQLRLLSLHTMIQAGCGDAEQGIIHIVGEAKSVAPCVIFMSLLDSWAVKRLPSEELQELNYTAKSNTSVLHKQNYCGSESWTDAAERLDEGSLMVTTLWNILLQQLQMLPHHVPLMILATSAVSKHKLPHEILEFFGHSEDPQAVKWHTVPCMCLQLPTYEHYAEVFDRASQNLSEKLAKHFVDSVKHKLKEVNESLRAKEGSSPKAVKSEFGDDLPKALNEHGSFTGDLSLKEGSAEKKRPLVQESPSEQKALSTAIRLCGSQLLEYPKFSALRLATKKLKAGPSIALAGLCTTWMGGNTGRYCAGSAKFPAEVFADGSSDSREENKAENLMLWGLIAVGLKACKGLYATASDVAAEVGTIVELLRENIIQRVNSGKDEWQFFHLMRQAAALQDMLSSWVHDIQSLEKAAKASSSVPYGNASCRESLTKHATEVEETSMLPNNLDNLIGGQESKDCTDGGSQPSMLDDTSRSSQGLCLMVSQAHLGGDASEVQPADFQHLGNVLAESNRAGEASKLSRKSAHLEAMPCGGILADSKDCSQNCHNKKHDLRHHNVIFEAANRTSVGPLQCERDSSFFADELGTFNGRKYEYSLQCLEYLKLSIKQVLVSFWEEDGYYNSVEAIHDIIGDFTTMAFSRLRKIEVHLPRNEFGKFVEKVSFLRKTALGERMLTCQCLEKFLHVKAATMKSTSQSSFHCTEDTKSEKCRLNIFVDMDPDCHEGDTDKGARARCTENCFKTEIHASTVDGEVRDCDLHLAGSLCLSPIIDVILSMSMLQTRLKGS